MKDLRFQSLVSYLRSRFPLESLTDMQLLHFCEKEIINALHISYNERIADVLAIIQSYTVQYVHHMPKDLSQLHRGKRRLLTTQLISDFPPQEIELEDTGFGATFGLVQYGQPGTGKTVWIPDATTELHDDLEEFLKEMHYEIPEDPEDWELDY